MKPKNKRDLEAVLANLNAPPVLMDIGASGAPPAQWLPIAQSAIYVGFDPDKRDLNEIPDGQYARSYIINKAVTNLVEQPEITFYLTRVSHCSSTLLPDTKSLSNYLFADYFEMQREAKLSAITLDNALEQLGLPGVDWFKTDSQGTDLRLFQSLNAETRNHVLAVDMEPGLIDAYQDEDLFVDAHREMTRQGFWLSSLDVKGAVRMKQSTRKAIAHRYPNVQESHLHQTVPPSPGWCEARYLRTIESLHDQDADQRSYQLLWIFAMIEQQWGYALDIAHAHQQKFRNDDISELLFNAPLRHILSIPTKFQLKRFVKRILPPRLITSLRSLLAR